MAQEREERIHGKSKKQKPLVRWIVWGMAMVLFFNTFALIFQIYSIPALEFIKVSTRLSAQEDIQTYKRQSLKFRQAPVKALVLPSLLMV